MVVNYTNEPGIDFTDNSNVESFKEALKKVKGELNQKLPLVINGEKILLRIHFSLSILRTLLKLLLKYQKLQQKK